MKKFLALFLALITVLGLCACTGGGGEESGELTAADYTEDGRLKITVGITSKAWVLGYDSEENAYTKWIEDTCGVEISFVEFANANDAVTQITTSVAAGAKLPDIMLLENGMNRNLVTTYGEDEYFVNLGEYLADKTGASKIFWDRVESDQLSEVDRQLVLNTMFEADGKSVYAIPSFETTVIDYVASMPWISKTWLDKVGKDAPTSPQELLEVLKAFKAAGCEYPMLGTNNHHYLGYRVTDWIINFYTYFNNKNPIQLNDGKVEFAFTQDGYREGLKFVRQLITEGLLTDPYSVQVADVNQLANPTDGVSKVGIVFGHLTLFNINSVDDVIFEYEHLPTWGNAIMHQPTVMMSRFITEDCKEGKRDKAFEVLMTMFSEEGSLRHRYGEKGVDWVDADEGAKSPYGFDAKYKLLQETWGQPGFNRWAVGGGFNYMAEGESAQVDENTDPYVVKKFEMFAKMIKDFNASAEANNPETILPVLQGTMQEQEQYSIAITNIDDRWPKAMAEFIRGSKNINSDADWNAYLDELEDIGLNDYLKYLQTVYDRTQK